MTRKEIRKLTEEDLNHYLILFIRLSTTLNLNYDWIDVEPGKFGVEHPYKEPNFVKEFKKRKKSAEGTVEYRITKGASFFVIEERIKWHATEQKTADAEEWDINEFLTDVFYGWLLVIDNNATPEIN